MISLRIVDHPEDELIGRWKEVEWVYDKVDLEQKSVTAEKKSLKNDLRHQISKNLIIHRSETWEFQDDGLLILRKENGEFQNLKWKYIIVGVNKYLFQIQ